MRGFFQNFRFALRLLRQSPGFIVVALGSGYFSWCLRKSQSNLQ